MAKLSSLGSIRFHGVGGRTIAKVRKFDLGIIRRLGPDIIVLELGSNDLTKLPAQTVGSELETLVRYLHDEFNVKSIAVCQVIRRHSPQCTAYNLKVTKLHLYLKAVLEPIPYCLYWKHRGFWNSRENIYLPDGVHLNDLGNLKLFRSIRVMPPKRKSARQAGRSAAKITKRATPSSSASSDLAEVSAAQQTAEPVNLVDLTSVVTLAVTEALKAVGVGQTTPLSSPPTVNPSPGPVDASATVETATAAEIASISFL
ncbi:unnamed protein product [Porites lobata]|uniref:SGNH hydrolase-type esterase domain-containing protein n=1 Tax=Porites lobata TaxID=104759 RepID=A0ABN8NF34_9CNID|nr:unnamed protein product [Porites lobata]